MQGRRSRPNSCWSPLRLLPLALCLYKKIKRSFFDIVNKLQILELCDKNHIDTLIFWILKEEFCLEQFTWIFFIFFHFFQFRSGSLVLVYHTYRGMSSMVLQALWRTQNPPLDASWRLPWSYCHHPMGEPM